MRPVLLTVLLLVSTGCAKLVDFEETSSPAPPPAKVEDPKKVEPAQAPVVSSQSQSQTTTPNPAPAGTPQPEPQAQPQPGPTPTPTPPEEEEECKSGEWQQKDKGKDVCCRWVIKLGLDEIECRPLKEED